MDNDHIATLLRLYERKPAMAVKTSAQQRHNHQLDSWEFEAWKNATTFDDFAKIIGSTTRSTLKDGEFSRITGRPRLKSISTHIKRGKSVFAIAKAKGLKVTWQIV